MVIFRSKRVFPSLPSSWHNFHMNEMSSFPSLSELVSFVAVTDSQTSAPAPSHFEYYQRNHQLLHHQICCSS
ncbi:hypothetical protein ACHAXS_000547 [Conticribra weissflogii]